MVSVCMATYNGEQYIKEQINSILCQIKENDELIISDDSSTDSTINIIKGINDNRIRLIERAQFKNHILNFDSVLKLAEGDIIFMTDQDDVWLPNKVSIVSGYLTEYDLVLSDCYMVDSNKQLINESFFKTRPSRLSKPKSPSKRDSKLIFPYFEMPSICESFNISRSFFSATCRLVQPSLTWVSFASPDRR